MSTVNSLNILIIEDDSDIFRLLELTLKGHNLTHCFSAEEALKIEDYHVFDIVLLDVTLPVMDGFTFFNLQKEHGKLNEIPIIFLTGKSSSKDKVEGFKIGADDYITKPFDREELLARVENRARRKNSIASKIQRLDIELDIAHRKAFLKKNKGESEIHLTSVEFNILHTLIQSESKTVSRQDLISKVWGDNINVVPRVVDAHLSNLRKKIEPSQLQVKSVYGKGYCLIERVSLDNYKKAD